MVYKKNLLFIFVVCLIKDYRGYWFTLCRILFLGFDGGVEIFNVICCSFRGKGNMINYLLVFKVFIEK